MASPLGTVLANICYFEEKWVQWKTVLVQPSGLDMLMTLSPYFPIRAQLFNFFLISIAGTREFNSPLNLNRTKRFLFLVFSSNANLTTPFPLPSTERKRLLASEPNGILLRLENAKLTSSAHLITNRCLQICSSPCLLQSALDDLNLSYLSRNGYHHGIISYNINDVVNKHRNKPKDIITVPKKEIFIVLPYLGIRSKIVTQQLKSCISKFYGCYNPKIIFRNTRRIVFFPL